MTLIDGTARLSKATPAGGNTGVDPETELTLKQAAERGHISIATLNRYIASGRLPAMKMGGKNYVTVGDLDAAIGPVPVLPSGAARGGVTDEGLRAWAERVASTAPPLRPEQRQIIVAAFSSAFSKP